MLKSLKSVKLNKWNLFIFWAVLFYSIHFILFRLYGIKPEFFIWSDAEGYYQYLPQWFYYHNIKALPYAVSVAGGMTLNKYPCGTAILQAPFFFLAHIYCKIFGSQMAGTASAHIPYTGYSATHAAFIWIAAITYVYLGLVLLYKVLRYWFQKSVSAVAVIAVYLFTNLFYYTLFEPGMSHTYSFFTLTLFIYSLQKFFTNPKIRTSMLCGISLGLSLLIRPTNVFYVLLFLLFEVHTMKALKERLQWIIKNTKYFLVIVFLMLLVFLPQMLYWHAVAGKYFVYSYAYSCGQEETFCFWDSPKIGYVLFGVESGMFIYAPLFFLSAAGMLWMIFSGNRQWIMILVLFLLIVYANASWWAYTFSCSYGHRAFIEYYPLFIIPVAFILQKASALRRKFLICLMGFLFVVFAFTNIRMSQLYYKDPCWTRPCWTWESYNRLLNKVFFIYPQNKSLKKPDTGNNH